MAPDLKVTETGINIMTQENNGVYEHILSGPFEGRKWEVLALCVYEFSGDKIKNVRTDYDRLSLAKQAVKWVFAKRAVSAIINTTEKGLR